MAEIRVNATGGLKLYDADDSHYAQIVAGTITSNVDAITLGHDTVTIADNLSLGSDSAVLKFGADGDTTLTHTDGTGLTLNSTNKICFNDASQFIQGSSNAVLSLGATDEIDLTATAVDLNGTLNVSGVATFQSTPVFPDGSIAVADLDIDGATDIGAAVVDADLFIVDDGAGGTNRKVTASRIKTYVGGGITHASQWRLTTDFNGAVNPIASNLELVDTDGYGSLGDDMTESSGTFTFPSTGYWFIQFNMECYYAGDSRYNNSKILTTTDNSSYNDAARATGGIDQVEGATTHTSATSTFIFDVTNTTNCKVRFAVDQSNSGVTVVGDTNNSQTCMVFIRLGDT
jgi:hypothetical protein